MKRLFALIMSLVVLMTLLTGSQPGRVQAAGTANFRLSPSTTTVSLNDIFTVDVMLDTSAGQTVAGFHVFIDFDPAYLKAVDASGNAVSTVQAGPLVSSTWTQLANRVDNTPGRISFAYGMPPEGTPINTSGNIGIVQFKALQTTTGTAISFSNTSGRQTVAALAGINLTNALTGTSITINAAQSSSGNSGGSAPAPTTATPAPVSTPVSLADNLVPSVPLVLDADGKAQTSVDLTTTEKDSTLHIDSGTVMKTADDKPLTAVTAQKVQPAQAPPSRNAIVMCYNFGPDGAKFIPELTLTLKYTPPDPKAVPNEKDLYVAWWDGTAWQNLGGEVDPVTHTIKIKVSHFSMYSVMAAAVTPAPSASPSASPTASPATVPASVIPKTSTIPTPPPTSQSPVTSPPATALNSAAPSVTPAPVTPLNWPLVAGIMVVVIIAAVIIWRLMIKKKA